jgi:hypothetical protein
MTQLMLSRPAPLCSPSAYEAPSSNSGGVSASTRGTWSSRAMGDLRVGEPRFFFFRLGFGGFRVDGVSEGSRGGSGWSVCYTRR